MGLGVREEGKGKGEKKRRRGWTHSTRNVDLRNVGGQETHNLRDRCNFQGSADDDDQVGEGTVVVHKTGMERGGEVFAEECDIGLSTISIQHTYHLP